MDEKEVEGGKLREISSEEKVNKQSEEARRGSELVLKRLQTRWRGNERERETELGKTYGKGRQFRL